IKGNFADGAHYYITVGNKQVEINQQEVDTNRKNAQAAFAKAIQAAQRRISDAQDEYKSYRETMTTGWFGTVATFVFDHVSVTDPGAKVAILTTIAITESQAALTASNANAYLTAANALI